MLRAKCGILLAAAAVVALVPLAGRRERQGEPASRNGLSPEVVAGRAAALFAVVAPGADAETCTVDWHDTGPELRPHWLWRGRCASRSCGVSAEFIWEAATGGLVSASVLHDRPGPVGPPMTARDAASRAWASLEALGVVGQGETWRLAGRPALVGGLYGSEWVGPDRMCRAWHEADTGALVALWTSRAFPYPVDRAVLSRVHGATRTGTQSAVERR